MVVWMVVSYSEFQFFLHFFSIQSTPLSTPSGILCPHIPCPEIADFRLASSVENDFKKMSVKFLRALRRIVIIFSSDFILEVE